MIENTSGLEPLGRAVLVRMVEIEEMKTSYITIPEHVRANASVMEQRAEVIGIGRCAWEDEALHLFGFPIWRRPRAKIGDKVFVTKFAGFVTRGPADEKLYRLVNDRDIFCKITKTKEKSDD